MNEEMKNQTEQLRTPDFCFLFYIILIKNPTIKCIKY